MEAAVWKWVEEFKSFSWNLCLVLWWCRRAQRVGWEGESDAIGEAGKKYIYKED